MENKCKVCGEIPIHARGMCKKCCNIMYYWNMHDADEDELIEFVRARRRNISNNTNNLELPSITLEGGESADESYYDAVKYTNMYYDQINNLDHKNKSIFRKILDRIIAFIPFMR